MLNACFYVRFNKDLIKSVKLIQTQVLQLLNRGIRKPSAKIWQCASSIWHPLSIANFKGELDCCKLVRVEAKFDK